MHVNVGRDFQTGVPQQLLNDLGIFPVGVQQCPKGVPKCVVAHILLHLCTLDGGFAVVAPITNSEGKQVPVRYIGEQHVKEDLGSIPTAQDWLSKIKPERWMYGQRFAQDDSELHH